MPAKPPSPKLWFTNFWHEETEAAIRYQNPIWHLLAHKYDVQLDAKKPDFVFYSVFTRETKKTGGFWRYSCPRIFCSWESQVPDFAHCDWAFVNAALEDFVHPLGRAFYLPHWAFYINPPWFPEAKRTPARVAAEDADGIARLLAEKTKFAAAVFTNKNCATRNAFHQILSQYRRVESAGYMFQNIKRQARQNGDEMHSSTLPQFYRPYKFAMAFENASFDGYTTEKIALPLLAQTVPIYWGDPQAAQHFNPQAFINAHDFSSLDALAKYVVQVDEDDALYQRYLTAPMFPNNELPHYAQTAELRRRLARIFATPQRARGWRRRVQPLCARLLPRFFVRNLQEWHRSRLGRAYQKASRHPDPPLWG